MNIVVIGTGYVGLVTGVIFAELGNCVTCIDIDADKIALLKKGTSPIFEPGLEEMLVRNIKEKRISFALSGAHAISGAQVIFIGVGTPSNADGSVNLTYVHAAAHDIGKALSDVPKKDQTYTVIVNKSTVPIGTGDEVTKIIKTHYNGPFDVVSNPEFLREGQAITDCMNPDRIVIGNASKKAQGVMEQLYAPYDCPKLFTDIKTAEMIKYASNSFLATSISFINSLAELCEAVGADVKEVARGMRLDKRIGKHAFLDAGPGYGGSCFEENETVFIYNSPNLLARSFKNTFTGNIQINKNDSVIEPVNKNVCGFDLKTLKPTKTKILAITKRLFEGTMVEIKTAMGRSIKLTADHPVIIYQDAIKIIPAGLVQKNDRLIAVKSLPNNSYPYKLDLISLLSKTNLEKDVYVSSIDGSISKNYSKFNKYISNKVLAHPEEIKRHDRMSLDLYKYLKVKNALNIPLKKIQLYTAKGSATKINAQITIDKSFVRLIGYYLAEGYISKDIGREKSVRQRVGWCFHEDEKEYIRDVQKSLQKLGLKFIERKGQKSLTTITSSRIFAWLIEDILGCGKRSENKNLPAFAFSLADDLKMELLRGLISGDGAVTSVQGGRNFMIEYATVSKQLADGVSTLFQSIGIVPSIRTRWMNKSTMPAYIIRISGYHQLLKIKGIFGKKHSKEIAKLLSGYKRKIKQRGFTSYPNFTLLSVLSVGYEHVKKHVYSMETTTGTLVASSGLVCHNCFPKDVKGLADIGYQNNVTLSVLEATEDVNRHAKLRVIEKISALIGSPQGKKIAIWGLAFKAQTDDVRDAPVLPLLDWLTQEKATIVAFDPVAQDNIATLYPAVQFAGDCYDAVRDADCVVVMTEWNEFKSIDLNKVKELMKKPLMVDTRNVFGVQMMEKMGFVYTNIGNAQ